MIDLRKVYTVFLTEIQGNVIKKIMRAFLSERTLQKEKRLWNVLRHTALGDASFLFWCLLRRSVFHCLSERNPACNVFMRERLWYNRHTS